MILMLDSSVWRFFPLSQDIGLTIAREVEPLLIKVNPVKHVNKHSLTGGVALINMVQNILDPVQLVFISKEWLQAIVVFPEKLFLLETLDGSVPNSKLLGKLMNTLAFLPWKQLYFL